MEIVVYILLGFFILLSAFMLYREFQHLVERIKSMEDRLNQLYLADPKRVPVRTQEDLLDAIALLDMLEHKRQMEDEIELAHKAHEDKLLHDAKRRLQETLAMGTKRDNGAKREVK